MLDIINNDFRLLKMKERLLGVNNNEKDLEDYKKLAIEIDRDSYNKLVDKINNAKHNPSLEEEFEFLKEIETDYEQLYELQYRFREVYNKYTDEEIKLSPLDCIDIEVIRDRKNLISGYLRNLENLENSKKELEKYSDELVLEEKKKLTIEKRLSLLEDELKRSFMNSEGRIISSVDGGIGYTSVSSEYKKNNLDLESLMDDQDLLSKELKQAIDIRKEKEELLSTAEICYNSVPSKSNKEVLDSIKIDTIKVRYKLVLLKMANLVNNYEKGYEDVKNKRDKLLDLNKYRVYCLEYLGVKFSIDPFNRIKIREQLEFIRSLNDNSKVISTIRKKINSINNSLEEMVDSNRQFMRNLSDEIKIIKDNLSISMVDISSVDDSHVLDVEDEIVPLDNQIVKVSELPEQFMIDRVKEKTMGVVKRVNSMIMGNDKTDIVNEVPELVIEDITPVIDDFVLDDEILDDKEDEISLEDNSIDSLEENVDTVEEDVAPEVNPMFTNEVTIDVVDDDKEQNDDLLFQEINPFEDAVLFNDRVTEDEVVEKKADGLSYSEIKELKNKDNVDLVLSENYDHEDNLEDTMPDVFWTTQDTQDEVLDDGNSGLSFDEQIAVLMNDNSGNEKEDTKVRRLAA